MISFKSIMKRLFCILFSLYLVSFCFAQQKVARVTLKSGVTITGAVIELNPISHIVIQVAGINSRLEMNEVASIEDVSSNNNSISLESIESESTIIDQGDYPDNYTLKVGPYEIEMVLVRGALFNMGYDGKGSLRKNSEPVHKVQLSSFYVNKTSLSKELVTYLKKGTEPGKNQTDVAKSLSEDTINGIDSKDILSLFEDGTVINASKKEQGNYVEAFKKEIESNLKEAKTVDDYNLILQKVGTLEVYNQSLEQPNQDTSDDIQYYKDKIRQGIWSSNDVKRTEPQGEKNRIYHPSSVKDALNIVDAISSKINLPFGLITEAQCEYILTTDNIDKFALDKFEIIWCRDYYADYIKNSQPLVDPTGPRDGKYHVIRIFTAKNDDVYSRYSTHESHVSNSYCIRLSIPASTLIR